MKVIVALVIAALSAIELVLLAWLVILLYVEPGGGGEFRGIHQLAYQLQADMYLPIPAFTIVFVVVLVCYTREKRKAFISFACGLLVAITTSLLIALFADSGSLRRPWHLILNAIILGIWTTAIVFRRFISFETS